MRPKKTRWVRCCADDRCFRPKNHHLKNLAGVSLSLDEFETIRLCDLEGMEQECAANQMKIHRSTVSRIIKTARKKIADALVNMKAIKIQGGCCKVIKQRNQKERSEHGRKK